MSKELVEDILQHHGVKGMKWGVRNPVTKAKQAATRVKEEVKSRKRELQWIGIARKADKMSTKDLQKAASRIQQENDFKRLTKMKLTPNTIARMALKDKTLTSTKSSRKDYRNRGDMTDAVLKRKLDRLRAKDAFAKAMTTASKEQVEFGKAMATKFAKSDVRKDIARNMMRSSNLSVVDGSSMSNVIN